MSNVTPTFTFSGDPSTSDKDAVRFWIQDMGPTTWLESDQGILYVLSNYPNVLLASAMLCRAIASKFAQNVTKRVGDLSINYSDKSKQYLDLADTLEVQGEISGAQIYIGGISYSDKCRVASNPDRVKPPFRVDQFDNPSGVNNTSQYGDGWPWTVIP